MKDMMREAIGYFIGICPPEGISLVRDYLYIHRLSHYSVHTEESLAWLGEAIITFANHLRAPAGPFGRTMYHGTYITFGNMHILIAKMGRFHRVEWIGPRSGTNG